MLASAVFDAMKGIKKYCAHLVARIDGSIYGIFCPREQNDLDEPLP